MHCPPRRLCVSPASLIPAFLLFLGGLAPTGSSAAEQAETTELSSSFFEFPLALDSQVVKVTKVLDKKTGAVTLRFMPKGIVESPEDLYAKETEERRLRRERDGAFERGLHAMLANLRDSDTVRVRIVMKGAECKYPSRIGRSPKQLQTLFSDFEEPAVPVTTESLLRQTSVSAMGVERSSSAEVEAALSKRDVYVVAHHPAVASVSPMTEEGLCAVRDFMELSKSTYNPDPLPTYARGSGVRVATMENGIDATFFNCLSGRRQPPLVWSQIHINSQGGVHSKLTFLCLWNTAPSADFWHMASSLGSFGDKPEKQYNPVAAWIIDNSIETLSSSYERGGMSAYDCDDDEFVVMDDFAYRWPYPVFCNPTANDGYQYVVNWQCYNAISVGNVRHQDLNHYVCDDRLSPTNFQQSQSTNPAPVYGWWPDREMPHVVVPGIHPDGNDIYNEPWYDQCLYQQHGYIPANGTSLSAPICNGIAACVISANPNAYRSFPERVRAAIIATAQNVHGYEFGDGVMDERDGAGVVSGRDAAIFAYNAPTFTGTNTTAYEQGSAWGWWYNTDYSTRVFPIATPSVLPANKHLRVVFTWDSNPDMVNMDNSLSDIDLAFSSTPDGAGYMRGSLTCNSNVEVVDIPRSQLSPGQTYYAIASVVVFRVPSGARCTVTYYSCAWTWVADHAE